MKTLRSCSKRCILIPTMALDVSLRRWLLLPRFIQNGQDESRKAHVVGKTGATPIEGNQDPRGNAPKPGGDEKYRKLESIKIGQVKEAINYYRSQLVPAPPPLEEWVAENYFCQVPLHSQGRDRPSAVFGRVKTCFPSDGNIQNIREMELYFPRRDAAPDELHLRASDISHESPVFSFCVGVKMYLSEAERDDFRRSENIFVEQGYAPLYETGYIDLLEISEENHASQPWLYVFGSEWFTTVGDSVQHEMREQLQKLMLWGKVVLNYHPKRYSLQIRSLNEELDLTYGFSKQYLMMPRDTGQVLTKVHEIFTDRFLQGMG